jgi:hypothetical protein
MPKRGTPAVNAAGVRRRVIEGEGLGGFARRLTINGSAGGLFRPLPLFFLPGFLPSPDGGAAIPGGRGSVNAGCAFRRPDRRQARYGVRRAGR